jgi:hypothetical protein
MLTLLVYPAAVQAAKTCTYGLSVSQSIFTESGGTGNGTVSTSGGCRWTATSDVSWITFTSQNTGNGSGSFTFTVAANPTTTSRSGSLIVEQKTNTITQAGIPCTYAISPTTTSFAATAGTGSISVTAGTGCSWTTSESLSWVTITGGASGTGNGTVSYSVDANTSTTSRSGTMTIAGQTFTISQTSSTPSTSKPSTPTNLSAAALSSSQIRLSWTDTSNNEDGFEIWQYNAVRGTWITVNVGPNISSYTDSGLLASTLYTYYVRAFNNLGFSTMSNGAETSTTNGGTSDTESPTVSITSPTAGTIVNASVTVSASATDNTGVTNVEFYRGNGVLLGSDATSPYSISLDTTTLTNGSHSIYSKAYDGSGNIGTSTSVSITVDNGMPNVSLTSPLSGATVASTISVSANASDGTTGIKRVEFYRDNTILIGSSTVAPYLVNFDTTGVSNGAHIFHAKAIDTANNASTSAANTVTVSNVATITPQLVGFVPTVSQTSDIAVDTTSLIAYMASSQFGLVSVDISSRSHPQPLGAANPPFYGDSVAFSGSLAVVGSGTAGLHIVDITQPSAPITKGSIAGTIRSVAISGSYAYALQVVPGNPSHTDLIVISLANPSSPSITGRVNVTASTQGDIKVVGSLVYVAAGNAGLKIVDVSSPSSPRILGSLATAGNAYGLAVANGYAYVAASSAAQIINVSNSSNPSLVSSFSTSSANRIAVSSNRMYIVDGLLLKTVNTTNLAAPALLSSTPSYAAQGIAFANNSVLLSSANSYDSLNKGGLYVVDVTTPTAPSKLANLYDIFASQGVATSGSLAVVAGNTYGLRVLNVSNPSAPYIVGSLAGTIKAVDMNSQYAYALQVVAGNPSHTDLAVVSLANPSSPSIVGRVTVTSSVQVGVKVVGSLAYVAAGSNGLQIVNVSTPTAPTIVGSVATGGNAYQVAINGSYAYVASGASVKIINVSNPNNPSVDGTLSTGSATALAVAGTRLYVIDGIQLKIMDLSSPTAPTLLSTWDSMGAAAVDASGSLLFLATPGVDHFDTRGGIYVLDASNSSSLTIIDQVIVPGTTSTLVHSNGYIYAADAAASLDVISLGQ